MSEPAVSTVKTPTASSVASGALIGAPLATVLFWYLNTFVYPGQIPIEVASAGSSLITTLTATFFHVIAQLFARIGISLSPPPAE